MWNTVLTLLHVSLHVSTTAGEPEFNDDDVKAFLGDWLGNRCSNLFMLGLQILQTGEMALHIPKELQGRPYVSHSADILTDYIYELERRGFLHIERLWSDPSGMWQEANVTLAPKGRALRQSWRQTGDEEWFCVKWGRAKKIRIEHHETVQRGINRYRFVMATLDMLWTPEYSLHSELARLPLSRQQKMLALLRFDVVHRRWEMVEYDLANRDEGFPTDNVSRELGDD